MKSRLVDLLRLKALRRLKEPIQLASGEWSHEFIDGKEALAGCADLELACQAMVNELREAGIAFRAAGGLTLGADALAVGMALVGRCDWFFVRKEPKSRGTRRLIEGAQIGNGWDVLLVDDVVTTGGSIIKAYEVIRETGAKVVAASTLVDRGDKAARRFRELGIPYFPMATYADLGIPPVGCGSDRVPTPR